MDLVGHADRAVVDCNSITLKVGSEIYISPNMTHPSPATHTKRRLEHAESFTIPPGQFGFILTAESVRLPPDVMGFISIKATYKLKGLINVSGFHVDPGWHGQLIYSVFNAGPAPIHLEEGMPLFLLWVADLDEVSFKHKAKKSQAGIPPDMINNITGVLGSVDDVEKRINARLDGMEKANTDLREEILDIERRVGSRQGELSVGQAVTRVLFGITGAVVLMLLGAVLGGLLPELIKPIR